MNRVVLTPRRTWSIVTRAGTAVSAAMLMISVVSIVRADALPEQAPSTADQMHSRNARVNGNTFSLAGPTPTDQPPTTDEVTTTSSSPSTTSSTTTTTTSSSSSTTSSTTTTMQPPTTTILSAGGPTTTPPSEPDLPPPSLPHTGAASLAVVIWAILLLAFGRMTILVARPVKVTGPDANGVSPG